MRTLTHYRLQQCRRDTLFSDTLGARLAEQARYTVRQVAVGAGSARTSAGVQLAGRGAALAWAGDRRRPRPSRCTTSHSRSSTRRPAHVTEELFRGIADERARVAFSGHIQIEATAPGSQARQSLRGLIEGRRRDRSAAAAGDPDR